MGDLKGKRQIQKEVKMPWLLQPYLTMLLFVAKDVSWLRQALKLLSDAPFMEEALSEIKHDIDFLSE